MARKGTILTRKNIHVGYTESKRLPKCTRIETHVNKPLTIKLASPWDGLQNQHECCNMFKRKIIWNGHHHQRLQWKIYNRKNSETIWGCGCKRAEIIVGKEGLTFAWELGLRTIIQEGDAKEVFESFGDDSID